jgi:tetratricopeptide (TPR) repeat protein
LKSKNFKAAIFLAVSVSVFAGKIFACGPDFPNNLLDAGDNAVLQAPVADFQRELERMKLVMPTTHAVPLADGQKFYDQSTAVEMSDLAAALKREKISSEEAMVIMQVHLAERMKLNAFLKAQDEWKHYYSGEFYDTNGYHLLPNTNPPPVFPANAVLPALPREFALYFQGAIAWQKHEGLLPCESWQRLLELPETERHFKSTWAAFMVAQFYASQTNDYDHAGDAYAMKYFEQVRALATNGFADSSGLATASIGGEAKIYLRQKNFERAIELYLEQFAAGDRSALDSLRFSVERAIAESNSTPAQLKSLALNLRTQRVITAYLISRKPYSDVSEAVSNPDAKQFLDRTTAWLIAVESANVKDVGSASQLALAAYQAGNMDAAQRWVNRAGGEPVAQWLQAKLFMRAGKISGAAKLLAKLSREFPQQPPGTNASASFAQSLFVTIEPVWGYSIPIGRQTFGELGVLHLARREYAESLDALLRSGYWLDAAYVAECVLTTDELKNYVDRNWPAITGKDETEIKNDFPSEPSFKPRAEIRWLLARRIARETGGEEARNYFPTNYSGDYEMLNVELRAGRNENLPPAMRAKNLFAAAVMTRTNGMELFGTELEPDWAIYGGDYDLGFSYWKGRPTNSVEIKINLAGTDEIIRASSRHVEPEKRFHYRYPAAELAWEAAELMPDNSDDTARVLCTGGTWLKNTDPQSADIFYKALVRRCRKTILGDEADKIRWFPAQPESGERPRLETIEITPDLTNAVSGNGATDVFSTEFPVPGRRYEVREDEDLYLIARAVQRLGCPMTVADILKANSATKPSQLQRVGTLILIPQLPGATNLTNSPPTPGAHGTGN